MSIILNSLLGQICDDSLKVGNGFTLNKDKVYISKPDSQNVYNIYSYSLENKTLTKTKFNSSENDYHPTLSFDNSFILFNSNRPIPNSNIRSKTVNIWKVEIHNNHNNKPVYIHEINTKNHDSYPSLTKENDLYFNSDRPGGKGSMDIYFSRYNRGSWGAPINITAINTADSENDLTIAKDGSFIVFNRYIFKTKEIDVFVSYNKNEEWTEPIPLNKINQQGVWELTPTLSEDDSLLYLEINGKLECFSLTDLK